MGWDIETAKQAGLTGKIDDVVWVKYAREHKRISLTFDELRAEQGIRVTRELRLYGGQIIRLQGGSDQNKYRAVGRLLFYYPDWYPFLSKSDGISVISDVRNQVCKNFTPEAYHQKYHRTDAEQFKVYLGKRIKKPYKHRPRKKKIAPEQVCAQEFLDSADPS